MATDPVIFTEAAGRKIAALIRKDESIAPSNLGRERKNYGAVRQETIFAKLLAQSGDGFTWHEVFSNTDNEWAELEGGRDSGDEDEFLAFDLPGATSTVSDDPVILKRAPRKNETSGDWELAWIIISSSPGILWGKLIAPWEPGSETVTLQSVMNHGGTPFDEPPEPIAVRVIMPIGAAPAYLVGETDSIFAYEKLATDLYLLKSPQTTPIPQRAWEVIQAIGGGETAEWGIDYMRGHATEALP